jgi:hypothetical protein
MASPELADILNLYQKAAPESVLEYLQGQINKHTRTGIYGVRVVLWLMIVQRLQGGTLASSVQQLAQGAAEPLLSPGCRRVREGRISTATGGYCQARQRIPKLIVTRVSEEIVERLREQLNQAWPELAGPIMVLDGSTLQLEHQPELLQAYPASRNRYGGGHWPMLRLVVLHDASNGLAQRPCWGPLNGPQAVSEQELAETAFQHLPTHATVIGDRNFGVFSVAYAAHQRHHPVVLRLTDSRARKLVGAVSQPGSYAAVWKVSRWDGKRGQRSWPTEAEVPGHVIAWRIGRGKSTQWLFLFTTLELAPEKVVNLYGQRWNIETDLRALKRTVHLHHIHAQSVDMMEKELCIAFSAYNLVRAVMCLASRRARLDPRQLSFSGVLNVVQAAWPRLLAAPTAEQHDREFFRVLDLAARCKLPRRPKPRNYPRAVWGRGFHFLSRNNSHV